MSFGFGFCHVSLFEKLFLFGLTVRNVLFFDSLNLFTANIYSFVLGPALFLSSHLVIYLLLWLNPPWSLLLK